MTRCCSIPFLLPWIALFGCAVREVPLEESVYRAQGVRAILNEVTRVLKRPGSVDSLSARALLELAYDLSPGDARVIDGFGCLAWAEGDVARAGALFDAALRHEPFFDAALAHRAVVSSIEGDGESALEMARAALAVNPLNEDGRRLIAELTADEVDIRKAKYTLSDHRRVLIPLGQSLEE